ncbi:ABC transporter permease [Paenibacillus tarimensis]
MRTFVIKDLLLLLRDRKELVILILMPLVLIAILSFALGGIFDNMSPKLEMTVVLVNTEQEKEGFERFVRDVRAADLPEGAEAQLLQAAQQLRPQQLLRNMLQSESLSDMIRLSEMDGEAARLALERNEATAVVTIPPDFTYGALNKMLLDRGTGVEIGLEASEGSTLKAGVVYDLLNGFVRTVNFRTAMGQASGQHPGSGQNAANNPGVTGGVQTVEQYKAVSAQQYFTFGMAVMFILYIASSTASRAYGEKRHYTFERIVIAGAHPIAFLGGKAISAMMLAFVQLSVLFFVSGLAFRTFAGVSANVWLGLLGISASLSVCVGMLAALLTALNFRLQATTATVVFAGVFVSLLAFLGGSFFPVSQMPEWLQLIGEWTPNGAALSSYFLMMQGAEAGLWTAAIYRLLLLAAVFLAVGVWIFPKRRHG